MKPKIIGRLTLKHNPVSIYYAEGGHCVVVGVLEDYKVPNNTGILKSGLDIK